MSLLNNDGKERHKFRRLTPGLYCYFENIKFVYEHKSTHKCMFSKHISVINIGIAFSKINTRRVDTEGVCLSANMNNDTVNLDVKVTQIELFFRRQKSLWT